MYQRFHLFWTTPAYVFHVVEVDGVQDIPGKHVYHSLIIGEPGPYVRYPSHSFLPRLGPQVYMLLLDCRCALNFVPQPLFLPFWFLVFSAERKKDQVCSPAEYQCVFKRLNDLPSGVEHLVIQLGADICFFFFTDLNLARYPYCLPTYGVPGGCAGI